ncbi:hypothetical protein IWQ57_004157, partial [Coemansia nantahalensis]
MRVSNSSSSDGPAARLAERYHLSFGTQAAARRRVFARLAPHSAAGGSGGAPASSGAHDASDGGASDSGAEDLFDGNADQYFDAQMLLLQSTPPPQRPIEAESASSDSESDADSYDGASNGPMMPESGEAASRAYDEWQAQHALTHLFQQRRRRFLHGQRQRHGVAAAGADTRVAAEVPVAPAALQHPWIAPRPQGGMGAPASHDAAGPLFPSNDVDSYWYNQPETGAVAPGSRPAALRRLGHLPSVPRNPAAEMSRHAMLEVLRTHRPFAAPGDNSGSDEEGAGADAGRSEKPEAPDSELDGGNGCTIGGGAHGAQAAWRA